MVNELICMRGLPGSGKSFAAQQLWKPGGTILSTDDLFMDNTGIYLFSKEVIGEAHKVNQAKAAVAVACRMSPIIIDNTNISDWEVAPYRELAASNNYKFSIQESSAPWRHDVEACWRRQTHGVPLNTIKRMAEIKNST